MTTRDIGTPAMTSETQSASPRESRWLASDSYDNFINKPVDRSCGRSYIAFMTTANIMLAKDGNKVLFSIGGDRCWLSNSANERGWISRAEAKQRIKMLVAAGWMAV